MDHSRPVAFSTVEQIQHLMGAYERRTCGVRPNHIYMPQQVLDALRDSVNRSGVFREGKPLAHTMTHIFGMLIHCTPDLPFDIITLSAEPIPHDVHRQH